MIAPDQDGARVRKRQGFATLPNTVTSDMRVSIAARGLLLYLVSCSETWRFNRAAVATVCCCGTDKLRVMMRELRAVGYLSLQPLRGDGGRLDGWEWVVDLYPDSGGNRSTENPTDGFDPPHKKNNPKPPSEEQSQEPPVASQPGLFTEDPTEEKNAEKGKPPRPVPAQAKEDPSAAEFEAFWRAYPQHRRKEKPKAADAWRRVIAGKVKGVPATSAADLLRYLEAYTEDATVKLDYAPYPERWLTRFLFEPYTAPAEAKVDHRPKVIDLLTTYYVELAKISGKATISGEGKRAAEIAMMFRDAERWSEAEWEAMKTEAQRLAAGRPQANQATG